MLKQFSEIKSTYTLLCTVNCYKLLCGFQVMMLSDIGRVTTTQMSAWNNILPKIMFIIIDIFNIHNSYCLPDLKSHSSLLKVQALPANICTVSYSLQDIFRFYGYAEEVLSCLTFGYTYMYYKRKLTLLIVTSCVLSWWLLLTSFSTEIMSFVFANIIPLKQVVPMVYWFVNNILWRTCIYLA